MKSTLLKISMFLIFAAISLLANAQQEEIKLTKKRIEKKAITSHPISPIAGIANNPVVPQSPEQITLTWKGKENEEILIRLVINADEEFTIDWGDGNPATSYEGISGENMGVFSPVYGDTDDYTVIIKTENCSFTHLNVAGSYFQKGEISALDVSLAPNLVHLDCSLNEITTLDISQNTELIQLECIFNQLTALDVSNNTKLTNLNCYENQITELDVTNNKELISLDCSYLQLTELDISQNDKLIVLYCENNELTNLDVSSNPELSILSCSYNALTSLDVSIHTSLEDLYCDTNPLSSLDVSQNILLKSLSCHSNMLTHLDISQNPLLQELDCSFNQIPLLDVNQNLLLEILFCENNLLTTLDISRHEYIYVLSCDRNHLTTLNFNPNSIFTNLSCFDNALTLSDLYAASLLMADQHIPLLGTQTWDIREVEKGEEIDLSAHTTLGEPEVLTVFTIEKTDEDADENSDYILTDDGKLTFLTQGDYTVKMTNEALISYIYPTEVIANYKVKDKETSIEENKIETLTLYPNPVSDNLYVHSNKEFTDKLIIYDINGHILIQTPYSESGIDVNNLPAGIYQLKTITSEGESTGRFIKK